MTGVVGALEVGVHSHGISAWYRRWKLLPKVMMAIITLAGVASGQSSPGRELLQAAEHGDVATIKRLIAAGALLDPVDQRRRTPLLIAVEKGQYEAVALLIEAGADINAQAENMDTPWLLAGALGQTEMLRLMIPKRPDLSLRNRFGGNSLIPACERGHVDTVKVLLTTTIDVNHVNNLGWTCLLEAVILGDGGPRYRDVTKLVLAAGANPNIPDQDGVSPLTHAMRKGQHDVAKLIKAAGGQ